ncbi:hypothetical protein HXX76_006148 [Chlamydomonas incerta]|uniref:Jacalin-type lectin domain-containing protein n=1 Tax=Chlamydomonas incerta TaxID=51695 RepID=A0A835T281_CHLIN|nr:hypothetical protein HXX76_006148 [Chlamydomonas incerta]|eukprot:KAG2437499.1 hypothetical protein HXX76_006148 [Chlamydomonas incerta]
MGRPVWQPDTSTAPDAFSATPAVGGGGGGAFANFRECRVVSVTLWVRPWAVRGMNVKFEDGTEAMAGHDDGRRHSFALAPGECVRELSMWSKADGSRWGGLRLATSLGHTFEARISDAVGDELVMNEMVGSGMLMGAHGRAGADIDCAGLYFLRRVRAARLLNPLYHIRPRDVRVVPHTIEQEVVIDNRSGSSARRVEASRAVSTWLLREWHVDHLAADHYGVYVTVCGAAPVLALAAAGGGGGASGASTSGPCCTRGGAAATGGSGRDSRSSMEQLELHQPHQEQQQHPQHLQHQQAQFVLRDLPPGCGLTQFVATTAQGIPQQGAAPAAATPTTTHPHLHPHSHHTTTHPQHQHQHQHRTTSTSDTTSAVAVVPAGQAARCRLQAAVLSCECGFEAYLEVLTDNGAAWCRPVRGSFRAVDATRVGWALAEA